MRRHIRKQCTELINTLEEVHGEIAKFIEKKDIQNATGLLGECQEAAVSIGNMIEASEGEGNEAVSCLEAYCEMVYRVNEEIVSDENHNPRNVEKRLKKSILKAQSSINALPTKLEAVFLPYKASMWDSLESIWMAADEDPNCDAYVIPIPYYDRNPDGSFAQVHYEAEDFPDYVPITHYGAFDLEKHQPDMIFIHNPYDEYNYVTSVHPNFYSYNLKKHTDCLVYVPYYSTSGMMSESQAYCPSYMVVDYIVVQSKEIMEQFDVHIPREKFLPLGSPKFDRVIRLCNNPPEPPADWKEKMEGKRVYFYNTSISGMLEDTEQWLKKVRYVFDTFKEVEDACLLWRPHPLLMSTMESMRAEYKPRYEELIQYFIEENIGILDRTPDIESTIALSDAYIGDAGTSVTSLYGVAGKPLYIMNNSFSEKPAEDDWKAWVNGAVRGDRYDRYSLVLGNRIFEKNDSDNSYHFCCNLPNEYMGGGYYGSVIKEAGKVIIFPANAENILIMNPDDHSFHKIELDHKVGRDGAFHYPTNLLFSEHPEVFYLLPNRYPSLLRFDAKREKVSYIEDEAFSDEYSICVNEKMERIPAIRFFRDDKGYVAVARETKNIPNIIEQFSRVVETPDRTRHTLHEVSAPDISGITLKGPRLICIDKEGKRLRAIQLETGRVQERALQLDGVFTSVLADINKPEVFWFVPYRGTVLVKWNITNDTWEKVDAAIDGLISISRPQRTLSQDWYFSNGVFHEDKLILAPNWGNKFVEIDVNTNEAREWIPPFPYTTEDKSNYWKNGSIGFFYRDAFDYSLKFFYAPEHIIYSLNLYDNTAKATEFVFDKEEIFSLSTGFHKESQWLPYCLFEDVFNPLGEFIKGEVHGADFDKERQIVAYRSINASPDGDCGRKVYKAVRGR